MGHLQGQKQYTQKLQSHCLQLEERINATQRDIMELSSERDKIDAERGAIQRAFDNLRANERQTNDGLERRILDLETKMIKNEVLNHKFRDYTKKKLKLLNLKMRRISITSHFEYSRILLKKR